MADTTERKLDRYFRELTRWAEELSDTVRSLQQEVEAGRGGGGGRGGSRDPGRPPPPPELSEDG
jgi:hypothetical protein